LWWFRRFLGIRYRWRARIYVIVFLAVEYRRRRPGGRGAERRQRGLAGTAGMRKYVSSGPTSDFMLDLTLDGKVNNPTTAQSAPDASLSANLVVVLAFALDFASDYPTFAREVVPGTPDASLLDQTTINFFGLGLFDTGPQSVTQSVSFTLNDGDEIFVWGNLVASGTRGGSADAFNTASLAFLAGNVAGLTAVPLPAGAWLC
jgi:hypothetical protein